MSKRREPIQQTLFILLSQRINRMKRPYIFLVLFILLIGVGSFLFVKQEAQKGPAGMVVHPSNFDLSLTPGEPTTGTIYVDNATANELPIQVKLRNFTANGEEGDVTLTDNQTTYSLASWIRVTPDLATLPPHGTQKFTYSITPPTNAEPGGHFGSIVFATVPPKNLNQTGAALSQEVGSLILARIPGDVREQAILESFSAGKQFYEFGPIDFSLRIRNDGVVHVKPSGTIILTDMFGQKSYVPFQGANVLPGAVRKMGATYSKHFLIGKYNAQLIAGYGAKNEQLNGSTDFYAFPVKWGIIALIIIVLLFLIRRRLGKALRAILTGK